MLLARQGKLEDTKALCCRLQHAFAVDEQNSESLRIAYLTEAHPNLFGLHNGLEIKLLLRVSSSIKSENYMNLKF